MIVTNGDLWTAKIYITIGNQTAIMVRHYETLFPDPVTDPVDDLTLAQRIDAHLESEVKACISQDASYRGVGVQRRNPAPPGMEAFSTGNTAAGGVASVALPKQASGLITLRTQFAGPRYRGRTFVPFPGESDNAANGVPEASYVTRLTALGNKLKATISYGTLDGTWLFVPVVYSKKFGTWESITTIVARPKWATQKRRGDFGPENTSPI